MMEVSGYFNGIHASDAARDEEDEDEDYCCCLVVLQTKNENCFTIVFVCSTSSEISWLYLDVT